MSLSRCARDVACRPGLGGVLRGSVVRRTALACDAVLWRCDAALKCVRLNFLNTGRGHDYFVLWCCEVLITLSYGSTRILVRICLDLEIAARVWCLREPE